MTTVPLLELGSLPTRGSCFTRQFVYSQAKCSLSDHIVCKLPSAGIHPRTTLLKQYQVSCHQLQPLMREGKRDISFPGAKSTRNEEDSLFLVMGCSRECETRSESRSVMSRLCAHGVCVKLLRDHKCSLFWLHLTIRMVCLKPPEILMHVQRPGRSDVVEAFWGKDP